MIPCEECGDPADDDGLCAACADWIAEVRKSVLDKRTPSAKMKP